MREEGVSVALLAGSGNPGLTSGPEAACLINGLTLDQPAEPGNRALDLLRPLIKAGLVRRVGTKKSGRYVLA
ncbi:MAG: hypothetical protein M3Q86_04240 [Verrucomicrobiota bacterium]|nr:hypothetical protein [Verrucomicrobiota bacterium]